MKSHRVLLGAAAASAIAVAAAGAAIAHSTQGGMGSGTMMGPGMMQGRMGSGMMMGRGMMHGHMGPGMMTGRGMMRGGKGAMFGRRVVPTLNISVKDVRGYLAFRLERIGNKRLKVGEVKADGGTITADIVTVDKSLVQRLKIDRRTGAITYEN